MTSLSPDRIAELERLLKEALAHCRLDSQLLDGHHFDEAEHDRYDAALAALLAELETLREALDRLQKDLNSAAEDEAAELRAELADCHAEAKRSRIQVEALTALDGSFQWLAENYPKALREMPFPLWSRFKTARAAVAEGAPDG